MQDMRDVKSSLGTISMTSRSLWSFAHAAEDLARSLLWPLLDVLLAGLCVVIWSVAIERAGVAWVAVGAWVG